MNWVCVVVWLCVGRVVCPAVQKRAAADPVIKSSEWFSKFYNMFAKSYSERESSNRQVPSFFGGLGDPQPEPQPYRQPPLNQMPTSNPGFQPVPDGYDTPGAPPSKAFSRPQNTNFENRTPPPPPQPKTQPTVTEGQPAQQNYGAFTPSPQPSANTQPVHNNYVAPQPAQQPPVGNQPDQTNYVVPPPPPQQKPQPPFPSQQAQPNYVVPQQPQQPQQPQPPQPPQPAQQPQVSNQPAQTSYVAPPPPPQPQPLFPSQQAQPNYVVPPSLNQPQPPFTLRPTQPGAGLPEPQLYRQPEHNQGAYISTGPVQQQRPLIPAPHPENGLHRSEVPSSAQPNPSVLGPSGQNGAQPSSYPSFPNRGPNQPPMFDPSSHFTGMNSGYSPHEVPSPSTPPNKPPTPGIPNKDVKIPPPQVLGFTLDAPDFRLPKEECHSSSGAVGECLSPYHCGVEGGSIDGLCHQGMDMYAHVRSCCIFQSYCGYQTNKELTYLVNPGYPGNTTTDTDCVFKIDLLPGVCQVRLDFLELDLKPMTGGVCEDSNSLHIYSNNRAFIPVKQLCGSISKGDEDPLRTDVPHLYIHVDQLSPQLYGLPDTRLPQHEASHIKLNIRTKNFKARWNVRVSQIMCDGANLQAPTGCGQYYNSNSGNISSLNFKDGQYMKNLRLAACIKRDPTACAVEYNFKHFGVGETKGGPGKLGFGLTCKDYLIINGEKTGLCGSLNAPRKMTFPAHGPESIFFYSDETFTNKVDVGYHIEYQHIHNCKDIELYKYPARR